MDPTQERLSPKPGAESGDAAAHRTSAHGTSRPSSDEIRGDIRRTRERIDHHVDELQETMEPRRLVHDGWNQIRSQALPALGRVARRHPIPITLLGLGASWFALDLIRDTRNGSDSWESDLGERHDTRRRRVGARMQRGAQRVRDAASEGVEEVRHRAQHAREQTSGKVRDAQRVVRERGRATAERARRLYDDNPLALGAAVLAAGVVAGISLPSTRFEDRYLGEASERVGEKVKEQTRHAGQVAVERGREAASAAVGAVREELLHPEPEPEPTRPASPERAG